jgi:hypothetical protein
MGSHNAKIVALSHFGSQFLFVWIGARAFDENRFAAVIRDDGDALIEGADIDVPFDVVGFVNGAPQTAPPKPGDRSTVDGEDVLDAAVSHPPNQNFAGAHEVPFKDFAGHRY